MLIQTGCEELLKSAPQGFTPMYYEIVAVRSLGQSKAPHQNKATRKAALSSQGCRFFHRSQGVRSESRAATRSPGCVCICVRCEQRLAAE